LAEESKSMTPRQQRRLEQKLARKAAKKSGTCRDDSFQPTHIEEPGDSCTTPISEAKLTANRANAQL
jgi:hypothetical protein